MGNQKINIGNIHGDAFGIGASGVVAKNITGNIHIGADKLNEVPDEYSKSLKEFEEKINQLFNKYQVPADQGETIQKSVEDLASEVAGMDNKEEVDYAKKLTLKAKLASTAAGLAKLLPKGAEVVSAFTPLAPFSKIIGEAIEVIVQNVIKPG